MPFQFYLVLRLSKVLTVHALNITFICRFMNAFGNYDIKFSPDLTNVSLLKSIMVVHYQITLENVILLMYKI